MADQYETAMLRSAAYDVLSAAFLYPEQDAGAALATKTAKLAAAAFALPWPDVAAAAEAASIVLGDSDSETVEEAFLALFGHTVPVDCPPYETEYGQSHIFQKSQTLADVAAFYAAFGVSPNPALRDRQDHLCVELAFMHFLTLKEAYALSQGHGPDAVSLCRDGQRSFLSRHLATWAKTFASRVRKKAGPANPYLSLVHLLEVVMDREFAAFQLTPEAKAVSALGARGPGGPGMDAATMQS